MEISTDTAEGTNGSTGTMVGGFIVPKDVSPNLDIFGEAGGGMITIGIYKNESDVVKQIDDALRILSSCYNPTQLVVIKEKIE